MNDTRIITQPLATCSCRRTGESYEGDLLSKGATAGMRREMSLAEPAGHSPIQTAGLKAC